MSGRRRGAVAEDARLFGQTSFIYEAGCVLVLDSEEQWLTDGLLPGERSVHEQIAASGAPALLLDAYPAGSSTTSRGPPGARSRTCSADSSTRRSRRAAARRGHGGLRLVDNGVVRRRSRRWPAFRTSAATT